MNKAVKMRITRRLAAKHTRAPQKRTAVEGYRIKHAIASRYSDVAGVYGDDRG